ncbi:unnamed protein product [Amoebophrya sp. A25]|nr:unnamed protein product [Amoebophrya sp. A25]|eukprot:GSA25T00014623001.1
MAANRPPVVAGTAGRRVGLPIAHANRDPLSIHLQDWLSNRTLRNFLGQYSENVWGEVVKSLVLLAIFALQLHQEDPSKPVEAQQWTLEDLDSLLRYCVHEGQWPEGGETFKPENFRIPFGEGSAGNVADGLGGVIKFRKPGAQWRKGNTTVFRPRGPHDKSGGAGPPKGQPDPVPEQTVYRGDGTVSTKKLTRKAVYPTWWGDPKPSKQQLQRALRRIRDENAKQKHQLRILEERQGQTEHIVGEDLDWEAGGSSASSYSTYSSAVDDNAGGSEAGTSSYAQQHEHQGGEDSEVGNYGGGRNRSPHDPDFNPYAPAPRAGGRGGGKYVDVQSRIRGPNNLRSDHADRRHKTRCRSRLGPTGDDRIVLGTADDPFALDPSAMDSIDRVHVLNECTKSPKAWTVTFPSQTKPSPISSDIRPDSIRDRSGQDSSASTGRGSKEDEDSAQVHLGEVMEQWRLQRASYLIQL